MGSAGTWRLLQPVYDTVYSSTEPGESGMRDLKAGL